MVYKMVGADQSGKFPPRVETAISSKIATEVSTDGKAAKEALDGIFAPISGSANYAPASGSANYAPAAGSTKYASLDSNGKVPVAQLPTSSASLRTAVVNLPPVWEKVTTTASAIQTRGVYFVCTNSGTVKKLRAKINSQAGQVYTLGIYELSPTNRTTVTAVVGTANFTETVSTTGKVVEVDVNVPIVAGKYYLIAIFNANLVIYYSNAGGYFSSAVSTTVWEGSVDPQRSSATLPAANTVMTGGSDYVCVGMSVDY